MTGSKNPLVLVLLVEDEPADTESTRRALPSGSGADFELLCAQELPEALEHLRSGRFDVLLLDLGLPGCCGLEALQEIRRENRDIPIVVLTGLNDERVALEAIEQGAQDYLIKGKLTAESLTRSIRYAMQRQELLAAAIERELAVSTAEARKSAMLDSALDAIVTIDHDGKIVEFNPAAERTFGRTRSEMMGQPIADTLIPPLYRKRYRQGLERYLATGEDCVLNRRLELIALRSDGAEFPVELTVTRIPIPGPPMFTAYLRDVSERKQAEENLRFTQFTIDHVATPVLWADAEGRFFSVNDAACRLTGYSRAELLARSVSDVDTSVSRQDWGAVWSEIQRHGALATESRLRRKDGTEIAISLDSNLLQLGSRECSCTFLHDITERKQAEQAQRESELRFRAVFKQLQLQIERMPLAYILLDADLRIVDWNPAAEKVFGYRKEEVLSTDFPFERIVAEAFKPHVKAILQRIQGGSKSTHSTNDNLTKDGRTITCEWLTTPLESDDGSFGRLMCLAQDVTDRRRLEEQFRQSQKLEAVGSLAGSIAHEFNNLLQAISGYTRFAIEGLAPAEQRCQDLQMVLKSSDRAVELTKQLLSFGRRQVLQRESVDPNQVVADLVKMLRRLIGESIEIQTHLAPDTAAIYADSGQLQQVLLNLCINARDAMPSGGRLVIGTRNISLNEDFCKGHAGAKAGYYVLMSVADTGFGMSAEVKSRIFEPFFTTKELGKGTGLGLAMVYGMVEQHGGIIQVHSEPGAGTTFSIYLPVSTLDKTPSSPAANPTSIGGSETILVVEDDPMVRGYMVRILETAGYKTLAAADGAAGLQVFKEHAGAILLAVLDVVMPRMGGRELFHRLRLMAPDIGVIFCTGHDPEVFEAEAIQKQGFPLLHKPVEPALFLQTIRAVLDAPTKNSVSSVVPIQNDCLTGAMSGLEMALRPQFMSSHQI